MPPIDSAPHGGEVMHKTPQDKKFPQAEEAGDGRPSDTPDPRDGDTDVRRRPEIPSSTEATAADMEDEDDDPVIDTGPGIADGANTLP